MSRGRSVIVGGGLQTSGALGIGGVLVVANTDPPTAEIASPLTLESSFPRASHLIVGQTVSVLGLGRYNTAVPAGLVIIGHSAEARAFSGTANSVLLIGSGTIARSTAGTVTGTIVIGQGASAITAAGILGVTVIGSGAAYTGGQSAVLIGDTTSSPSASVVIVGSGASGRANNVVVGTAAASDGNRNTLVGDAAVSTGGTDNVVIGQGASVIGAASRAVSIGGTNNSFSDAITMLGAAFQANTLVIGGATSSITTVLVGKGNTSATPAAVTFRNTNAVGADIVGGHIIIQAGLSTGVAAPAVIQFNLGGQGTTGALLQTAFAAFKLSHTTAAGTFATLDTAVAGNISQFKFAQATVEKAAIGVAGAANDLITTSAAGDLCVRSVANVIRFSTDNGVSDAMDLSTAGILNFNKDRAVRFNNATTSAGAAAGTLGNAPTAGNPGFWLKINIAGTNYAIPCWLG